MLGVLDDTPLLVDLVYEGIYKVFLLGSFDTTDGARNSGRGANDSSASLRYQQSARDFGKGANQRATSRPADGLHRGWGRNNNSGMYRPLPERRELTRLAGADALTNRDISSATSHQLDVSSNQSRQASAASGSSYLPIVHEVFVGTSTDFPGSCFEVHLPILIFFLISARCENRFSRFGNETGKSCFQLKPTGYCHRSHKRYLALEWYHRSSQHYSPFGLSLS